MKKFVSVILSIILVITSFANNAFSEEEKTYSSMGDVELLGDIEDVVFASLENDLQSDNYIVENVVAIYISQEYLDELAFNSLSNIFFGYTLEEVEEQFQGTKFVFTLGNDNRTIVKPFEVLENNTFATIIRNVAIGSGVILLCVTISIVATTVGAPATVSVIFATAAKTATAYATKGFIFGGLSAAIIKAIETGNFDEAIEAGLVAGSEGFKWGAISGAVIGGFSKAVSLRGGIRSPRDSEVSALNQYGGTDGREQVAFLNGEEVKYSTYNATRPDIVKTVGDHIEAIEVKNYRLDNENSFRFLQKELIRQVSARIENLPAGSTQRIFIDVKGRGYSLEFIYRKIAELQSCLDIIYPGIPIDYML